jgi:type II secretory ATPase GspE/PulE/Tfp pilus assembly ATPase PilB-like protein
MGVESFLLVSTLRVIIGQRLVRRLTSDREEYKLTAPELAELEKKVDLEKILKVLKDEKHLPAKATVKDIPFYKPKEGGESADGYTSRMGIHEILNVSHGIRDLMLKGSSADQIEEFAKKEGMLTMLEDGIYKAARGITTIEEVLRVITE